MVIDSLHKAFKRDDVKEKVFRPEWLSRNRDKGIHSKGFCYAVSTVIYRLTGCSEKWKKMSISKKTGYTADNDSCLIK